MINIQSMQKMADILREMRNPSLKEDTDKSEPGTQGDKEAYEKKRDAVLKKFGVKSCASCETEEEKKACFKALDDAHVADHEEQVQTEAKVKHECPKCKGEGCDHCDGKGYHLEDEDKDPVGKNEEVEIEEGGLYAAKEPAYPPTIDNLRMIVKNKQHQKFMFPKGQAIVATFTASAMVQVYDALKKPDMKKTFEKMIKDKAGFMKTQAFAMKMIGKGA